MADLREMRPKGRDWAETTCPASIEGIARSAWRSGPLLAFSTLVEADLPDGSGVGLQWHLSVSCAGARPTNQEVKRALRAFKLKGAEEDNHHPGVARHFWRPVDAKHRVTCECKASEETIREADGYTWTNPRDGACRGCEFERLLGKPCPLHRAPAAPLREPGRVAP